MTQQQLILGYINKYGSILPAKCAGLIFDGEMMGSETSRRCRALRKQGILRSEKDGKFERFYLATQSTGMTAQEFLIKYPSKVEVKKEKQQTMFSY